jgi:hypothetical protein
MKTRYALAFAVSVAAMCASTVPTRAATINYNLTGDPADLNTVSSGTFLDQVLVLTNADTGLQQVPGGLISVGDTINATVTLNGALTMPASSLSSELILVLAQGPGLDSFTFTQSVSYFLHGAQVAPPAGFANILNGGSPVILGQAAGVPTPSFLFDEVVYNATLDNIFQVPDGNLSSLNLLPGTPALEMLTAPSPVPLPAAIWLFLPGLGGLGLLARRKS